MSNDLQQAWDQLQTEISTSFSTNKEEIMDAITHESRNPIYKLKHATQMRLNWTLFFSIFCFAGAILSYNYPRAILLWGIAFAYYFGGWIMIRHHLQHLKENVDDSIKSVIENYYYRLTKMLSIEERVGTFIIPLSVIIGYSLSGVYDGETFVQIFEDGMKTIALMGVTIIFSAISFWVAKKLNYKAYGKYLEKLKTNLDILDTIE